MISSTNGPEPVSAAYSLELKSPLRLLFDNKLAAMDKVFVYQP